MLLDLFSNEMHSWSLKLKVNSGVWSESLVGNKRWVWLRTDVPVILMLSSTPLFLSFLHFICNIIPSKKLFLWRQREPINLSGRKMNNQVNVNGATFSESELLCKKKANDFGFREKWSFMVANGISSSSMNL
ncbi:hypothetical protein PanWU01x14_265020, partial [Parasponia andersonii]